MGTIIKVQCPISVKYSGKPSQADLRRYVAPGHPQVPGQGQRQDRGDRKEPVRRGIRHHHTVRQAQEGRLQIRSEAQRQT